MHMIWQVMSVVEMEHSSGGVYRHQVPVDFPEEPLVRSRINLNDLSFCALEGFHRLVGIIRVFEYLLVQTAISDSIRQRLWDLLVALRVVGVLSGSILAGSIVST